MGISQNALGELRRELLELGKLRSVIKAKIQGIKVVIAADDVEGRRGGRDKREAKASDGVSRPKNPRSPGRRGSLRSQVNRTGFVGGLIPREDGAHAPTQQVLPRAT